MYWYDVRNIENENIHEVSSIYCTVIDFCWGGHEMLVNSKLHIDRRE